MSKDQICDDKILDFVLRHKPRAPSKDMSADARLLGFKGKQPYKGYKKRLNRFIADGILPPDFIDKTYLRAGENYKRVGFSVQGLRIAANTRFSPGPRVLKHDAIAYGYAENCGLKYQLKLLFAEGYILRDDLEVAYPDSLWPSMELSREIFQRAAEEGLSDEELGLEIDKMPENVREYRLHYGCDTERYVTASDFNDILCMHVDFSTAAHILEMEEQPVIRRAVRTSPEHVLRPALEHMALRLQGQVEVQ